MIRAYPLMIRAYLSLTLAYPSMTRACGMQTYAYAFQADPPFGLIGLSARSDSPEKMQNEPC
eukprot:3260117-Rhodomonas_salina.1